MVQEARSYSIEHSSLRSYALTAINTNYYHFDVTPYQLVEQ